MGNCYGNLLCAEGLFAVAQDVENFLGRVCRHKSVTQRLAACQSRNAAENADVLRLVFLRAHEQEKQAHRHICLIYTSPSPRGEA